MRAANAVGRQTASEKEQANPDEHDQQPAKAKSFKPAATQKNRKRGQLIANMVQQTITTNDKLQTQQHLWNGHRRTGRRTFRVAQSILSSRLWRSAGERISRESRSHTM